MTWICSTGPSAEAVTLLSSIPWPLGTGLYSMTFSMPPRGLEDTMHGSPSEVGLQQSETRHVEGEQGRSRKISREELWISEVASLVKFEVLHSNLITIHCPKQWGKKIPGSRWFRKENNKSTLLFYQLETQAISSFTFQSFQGFIGTLNKNMFFNLCKGFLKQSHLSTFIHLDKYLDGA